MAKKKPKTQERERLTAACKVRMTEAEKARLEEEAEIAGVTVSELLRRRFFGRPIVAKGDMAILRELRRVGGLLKHIYLETGGKDAAATSAAWAELQAAARRVGYDSQEN